MKVLDTSVSLNQFKKYFTIDAWKQVQGVVAVLEEKGEWSCACCSGALETSQSISSDCCLDWMHMKCVGLKSQPKPRENFGHFDHAIHRKMERTKRILIYYVYMDVNIE